MKGLSSTSSTECSRSLITVPSEGPSPRLEVLVVLLGITPRFISSEIGNCRFPGHTDEMSLMRTQSRCQNMKLNCLSASGSVMDFVCELYDSEVRSLDAHATTHCDVIQLSLVFGASSSTTWPSSRLFLRRCAPAKTPRLPPFRHPLCHLLRSRCRLSNRSIRLSNSVSSICATRK